MTSIAVAGAAGRMGRAIVRACRDEGVAVSHAFERHDHACLGADVGELAGVGALGVTVAADVTGAPFDVLVEFTDPDATVSHLDHCRALGAGIVIGTTGLSDRHVERIAAAAAAVPIVVAPNMSVGVNVVLNLLETTARVLADDADVEIVETHHRHKIDAPSGTALKMGEVVAAARGGTLAEFGVFARHGQVGPRPRGAIGFATVRAGDVVGEHRVLFASKGERVEIVHKASSRANFARGALRAARWLADRDSGLFDMRDVLGLKPQAADAPYRSPFE